MYAWIWGHLPGPVPVRALIALVLVAAIVVLLFGWVFPWVDGRLEIDNTGVRDQAAAVMSAGMVAS